jgi:hypothetical protein
MGGMGGTGGRAPAGGAGGDAPRGGSAGIGGSDVGGTSAVGGASGGSVGDAGEAGASNGGASGAPDLGGSGGSTVALPHIDSFTGPTSACAGSDIDLAYSYSGGSGLITPGNVAAAQAAGHATVTLGSQDTTYTLSVTAAGAAPATATAKVLSIAAPTSAITTSATVAHGDSLVQASVSAQTQATYAWAISSGNATINGSAAKNQVAFDVGATGTEVTLQVTVTSTASACASTSTVHIPIRCGVPVLASFDRSKTPAVTEYVPNNAGTGNFDMTSSGGLWTAYLAAKTSTASYNTTFDRFSAGTWNVPASSPVSLNDTTATHVLYSKVATDNAGDAVFVWTETADNNNYSVMLSAYRVSDNKWSTAQLVGTVFNQASPVQVQINRSTGTALIAWVQGPFTSQIPHVRSYTVSSNLLGTDTPLRTSTTNKYTGDQMALDFAANDALTGFVSWFEQDSTSTLAALYALHVTAGVPDTVSGGAYDIKQLAQGTQNFTTDVFNFNSQYTVSSDREPHMLAVSANGNGAVVWGVYNGLSTGANKGQLYVRRYTSGAWGAAELAASQGPGFAVSDLAIDDTGNVIANVWTNNVGYDFFSGVMGSAWAAPKRLANVNGSTALPHVALDSTTGKGIATFRDPSIGVRAPLRGVFYDPTDHSLSAAFTIDDPQQSGGESGRVRIDGTGLATVLFTQLPAAPPVGSNSSNSSLLFSTTCK